MAGPVGPMWFDPAPPDYPWSLVKVRTDITTAEVCVCVCACVRVCVCVHSCVFSLGFKCRCVYIRTVCKLYIMYEFSVC